MTNHDARPAAFKTALTDRYLKAINPPSKPDHGSASTFHRDTIVPGLALRVTDGGVRTWIIEKRLPNGGKTLRRKFGRYPTLALADARDKARELMRQIEGGEDPREVNKEKQRRAEQEKQKTFAVVTGLFIKNYVVVNRPKSEKKYREVFASAALKDWQTKPVGKIMRDDVRAVLDRYVEKGKLIAANRMRAHLSKFFNWAALRGYVDASPVAGVERPLEREKPRDRVLTDDEVKAVWKACDTTGDVFSRLVQVLILTGVRRSEAANVQWQELDLDNALWTIPGERMKNGGKHVVPLSAPVVAILRDLKPAAKGYVFCLSHGANVGGNGEYTPKPLNGFSKSKDRLDTAAGVTDWHLHDIRSTMATWMQSQGVGLAVVSALLSHRLPTAAAATRVYALHEYLAEKRQALDAWAAHVLRLAGGKSTS